MTAVRFHVAHVNCRWCGAALDVEVPAGLTPDAQLVECERQTEAHKCDARGAIYVVSTGLRCNRQPCLDSVANQRGVLVKHRWVDAGDQDPPKTCAENLVAMIGPLPPEAIVVWLDLDDRLVRPDALEIIRRQHAAGAWATYGSFVCKDGRAGFAAPYLEHESIRRSEWRATHLKSFRAGLFQRIQRGHLQYDGEWLHRAVDMAIMMPILEMAGHDRRVFVPEVLVEYDYRASFEFNATAAEREVEKARDAYVRGLPPYGRLESL